MERHNGEPERGSGASHVTQPYVRARRRLAAQAGGRGVQAKAGRTPPLYTLTRSTTAREKKTERALCHVVFVFRMRFMEMGVLCKAYKSNLQHPNTLQSRAHTETLTQSGVTSVLPFSISWHRRSSLRGSFQGKAFHERYLAADGFRPSPSCPGGEGNRRPPLDRR